jgi:glycosyltransferase involved in cell wall biosynthesis
MPANIPLISIVIPCYNVSDHIEKAVNSILYQSYRNLEIWIIDDASTDGTLEKINSFNDERIKVAAFKENTQKIGAVNEVLKKVNGDYIAFQDADDWSEPDRIFTQLAEFKKDAQLGICFTKFKYAGLVTSSPQRIVLTNHDLKNGFFNFNRDNNGNTLPLCASMMISRAALLRVPGYHPYFKGRVAEDIHWIYRILKHFRGITVDKILYNYSVRDGSMTQDQIAVKNGKYAYSWQLLSKIIDKDIIEGIEVLRPENSVILQQLELQACEEVLMEKIQLLNLTKENYENSLSYKVGKFILSPFHFLKRLKSIR